MFNKYKKMYIFLENGNILVKIINSIKILVDEGTFSCQRDKLEFKSLDKSHIVYIHLCLHAKHFDDYKFDEEKVDGVEKAVELLNVDISAIANILKWINKNDCIIWKSTGKDKMTFIIGSDQKRVFNLNLLNLEYDELEVPDVKYNCKLKMDSKKFAKICKDFSLLSENVRIIGKDDEVILKTESSTASGEITLSNDEENDISIKVKKEFNHKFDLQYFNHFSKSVAIANEVVIYFTQDSPAMIKYKIPHMGNLTFYLAPKEEDD